MINNIINPYIYKNSTQKSYLRSFVLRNNRLTFNQQQTLKSLWSKMGINFTKKNILYYEIFKNFNPIILEIGFGIGTSLIYMAQKNRNINFLGIEVYIPGINSCLTTAEKIKLTNLRIICHDAVEVLETMIPKKSLYTVQIFFPDPWHKKKHNKRRLIQKYFINLVLNTLILNGIFHIATDSKEYAEHILKIITEINNYKNLSPINTYVPKPISRPTTKFEIRGITLGYDIYDLMFKKIK